MCKICFAIDIFIFKTYYLEEPEVIKRFNGTILITPSCIQSLNLQPIHCTIYSTPGYFCIVSGGMHYLKEETKEEVCMWHVGSQVSVFRTGV